MDPINAILNLLSDLQSPSTKKTSPADGPLQPFEQAIDSIVTQRINASKANAQASLQKAKIQAEQQAAYQRELNFVSSELQAAKTALAAVEGSSSPSPAVQNANQVLDFKRQEVAYWEGRLRHVSNPQEDGNS
jgi:hypothetical protein